MFITFESVLVVDAVLENSNSVFVARNFEDVVLAGLIAGWTAGARAVPKVVPEEAVLIVVLPAPIVIPAA